MKRSKITWHNIAVVLGILVPEAAFFWATHKETGNLFLFAALVFLWSFGVLAARFFLVRFIFEKKDKFIEHLLVMFLTSNYFFFGFATWIFVDDTSATYTILPFALLFFYAIVWLSQRRFFWELFTFATLGFGLFFAWELVFSLAFSGGYLAALTLYVVFISAYNWGHTHKLQAISSLFFACLTSLILSEVAWILLLWPIDLFSLALIMFGMFYVFGSLALHSHKKTLRKRHVLQFTSLGLLYFLALCLTTEWKLPLQ